MRIRAEVRKWDSPVGFVDDSSTQNSIGFCRLVGSNQSQSDSVSHLPIWEEVKRSIEKYKEIPRSIGYACSSLKLKQHMRSIHNALKMGVLSILPLSSQDFDSLH